MSFVRLIALAIALVLFSGFVIAQNDKVDINHASVAELKTLPGIGDAYSAAIVKHRPYKNKTQLRSHHAIPASAYEKIKDKIIAKQ